MALRAARLDGDPHPSDTLVVPLLHGQFVLDRLQANQGLDGGVEDAVPDLYAMGEPEPLPLPLPGGVTR